MARPKTYILIDISLLGTMLDTDLSKLTGYPKSKIQRYRNSLGIESFRPRHFWTSKQLKMLDTMNNVQVAAKLGLTPEAVKAQRYLRNKKKAEAESSTHIESSTHDHK